MTVLIVGGAGYIGSHVNKIFHQQGWDTIVLDNLSRGFRDAVRWGSFVEGDCGDVHVLDRVFSENHIDLVMHFAAFAYVGESVGRPDLYYRNNVAQTLTLLDAVVRHKVFRFVFSSTCATFGEARYLPIDEGHPQVPVNPYGRSKLMVESILADYDQAFGLKSCIFRYFNAAGCDPDGLIGENHDPETHVIPLLLEAAAGKRESFSILGSDYPTDDGTCVRDYIHVTDLAQAHVLGAQFLMETGCSDQFNLGNGRGFSVKELVKAAERITGHPIPVEWKTRRAGDPPTLVGGAEKARRVLGWNPRYATLDEILITAWKWMIR
jgi:UDP-glucose 4-epimerase